MRNENSATMHCPKTPMRSPSASRWDVSARTSGRSQERNVRAGTDNPSPPRRCPTHSMSRRPSSRPASDRSHPQGWPPPAHPLPNFRDHSVQGIAMSAHNSDLRADAGERKRDASAYPVCGSAAARDDGDLVAQFKPGHLPLRLEGSCRQDRTPYTSTAQSFKKNFFCSSVIALKFGTPMSVVGRSANSGEGDCSVAAILRRPPPYSAPAPSAAATSRGQTALGPPPRPSGLGWPTYSAISPNITRSYADRCLWPSRPYFVRDWLQIVAHWMATWKPGSALHSSVAPSPPLTLPSLTMM